MCKISALSTVRFIQVIILEFIQISSEVLLLFIRILLLIDSRKWVNVHYFLSTGKRLQGYSNTEAKDDSNHIMNHYHSNLVHWMLRFVFYVDCLSSTSCKFCTNIHKGGDHRILMWGVLSFQLETLKLWENVYVWLETLGISAQNPSRMTPWQHVHQLHFLSFQQENFTTYIMLILYFSNFSLL